MVLFQVLAGDKPIILVTEEFGQGLDAVILLFITQDCYDKHASAYPSQTLKLAKWIHLICEAKIISCHWNLFMLV